MREPFEIDVTGLLAGNDGEAGDTVAALITAIKRSDLDQRVTWLLRDGIRCAALVSLEVGHAADPDSTPRPLTVVAAGGGDSTFGPRPAEDAVPGFTDL